MIKQIFRHLSLPVILILLASALLLLSDLPSPKKKYRENSIPKIALVQFASTPLLDEHIRGVIDELERANVLQENHENLRHFNAQGDNTISTTIAKEISTGNYDIIISSSTMSLQATAKANEKSKKIHVFGAVTDPYGTGVGITDTRPEDHPAHLVGIGTFQPVEELFIIAKEMNPEIESIGVVWNPSEQCSEACLRKARTISNELAIELKEATASNPSEVNEALRSLLSKKVDAIWIGGDTVANAASRFIINTAQKTNTPVITNDPTDVEKGALIGLGADYYTVGRLTAELAVNVLEGENPASIPIKNQVPQQLNVNVEKLSEFRSWSLTDNLKTQIKEQSSSTTSSVLKGIRAKLGRPAKIIITLYNERPNMEDCEKGLHEGLKQAGLIEGEDFILKTFNAQGDISTLSTIMTTINSEKPDLVFAVSTPCLQAAMRQIDKNTPIVFAGVASAIKAGAGKTEEDHLANVTGITTRSPFARMAKTIKEHIPHVHTVGTLYTPAEVNSVYYADLLEAELKKEGLKLHRVPVTSTADVSQSAESLCASDIQVIAQISDNTTAPGMRQIIRKADQQNIPSFVFASAHIKSGASLSIARDFFDTGIEASQVGLRVLLGESPAAIPFSNTKSEKALLNQEQLNKFGLKIDSFKDSKNEKIAEIAIIKLVDSISLNSAEKGLLEAFSKHGFVQDKDFKLKRYNAQADFSMIPQQIDAALLQKPDLILTISTPVFLAACQKVKDIPLIFTVASDPEKINAFPNAKPSNISGVYERDNAFELIQMALKHQPNLSRIALLYNASEPNAALNAQQLRREAEKIPLEIVESTPSSISNLLPATQALINKNVGAIFVGSDNLIATGFTAIIKATEIKDIPIYTNDAEFFAKGARAVVGSNYFKWGEQAGEMAIKVLSGTSIESLPIEMQSGIITLE